MLDVDSVGSMLPVVRVWGSMLGAKSALHLKGIRYLTSPAASVCSHSVMLPTWQLHFSVPCPNQN